mgnify:CR=1 FL=1
MKINITKLFLLSLNDQVAYISKDKPKAARKFKADLIKKLRKDLKFPYHFKKSIYYDNENIRDYVFKGYVSVYKIDVENNVISVFGFIKYKEFL